MSVQLKQAENLKRLEALFSAALELPPDQRLTYLAGVADEDVRGQLSQLLSDHEQASALFMTAAHPGEHLQAISIPQRIGPYLVKRIIGAGGMGTVYEAEQLHPRRTVAIKVLGWGILSRAAHRRFEYESELLARLRHPGIAQVFEGGSHMEGGRTLPYFVMEYIPQGRPITAFATEHALPLHRRLELMAAVCDAVHHAHEKGVIHRDLKPSNIMVDAEGSPRVIDFGVACSVEMDTSGTMQTAPGQLLGTIQ